MKKTVKTEDVQRHAREDYKIHVADPDLTDADLWLMSGCSREAAKQWHDRVLKSIKGGK